MGTLKLGAKNGAVVSLVSDDNTASEAVITLPKNSGKLATDEDIKELIDLDLEVIKKLESKQDLYIKRATFVEGTSPTGLQFGTNNTQAKLTTNFYFTTLNSPEVGGAVSLSDYDISKNSRLRIWDRLDASTIYIGMVQKILPQEDGISRINATLLFDSFNHTWSESDNYVIMLENIIDKASLST